MYRSAHMLPSSETPPSRIAESPECGVSRARRTPPPPEFIGKPTARTAPDSAAARTEKAQEPLPYFVGFRPLSDTRPAAGFFLRTDQPKRPIASPNPKYSPWE